VHQSIVVYRPCRSLPYPFWSLVNRVYRPMLGWHFDRWRHRIVSTAFVPWFRRSSGGIGTLSANSRPGRPRSAIAQAEFHWTTTEW